MFVFNLSVLYGHAKCKLVTVIICIILHAIYDVVFFMPSPTYLARGICFQSVRASVHES